MSDPTTFRDSIGRLGPPWTQGFWGKSFKYVAGLILDATTDALRDGVKARFPGVGTPEALPYIGNDRQIIRGFAESDASYAKRLSQAFDSWKHAGSAPSVARQLLAYVTPATPRIRVVSSTLSPAFHQLITTWVTLEAGVVTFKQVQPGNWDWDGTSDPNWSRFWVIIYPGVWTQMGTYGDGGRWGDGRTWGSSATIDQVRTLRKIIQQWKGSHSQCGADHGGGGIILAFDSSMFDPDAAPGSAGMPDGTWGTWSVGGVRTRATPAAYLRGFV